MEGDRFPVRLPKYEDVNLLISEEEKNVLERQDREIIFSPPFNFNFVISETSNEGIP
jgi:hypothetical protein